MTLLMIAIGGALGSVARYLSVAGATRLFGAGFPAGTLLVNIAGSFLMGMAAVLLIERMAGDGSRFAPLVMTGFLGGFTTFSAFSLDAVLLYQSDRIGAFLGYVVASVALSILALLAGMMLMRGMS